MQAVCMNIPYDINEILTVLQYLQCTLYYSDLSLIQTSLGPLLYKQLIQKTLSSLLEKQKP